MTEGNSNAWSIRNHLGCEVGYVETQLHEPVVAYAAEVGVPSEKLLALGYSAVKAPAHVVPSGWYGAGPKGTVGPCDNLRQAILRSGVL